MIPFFYGFPQLLAPSSVVCRPASTEPSSDKKAQGRSDTEANFHHTERRRTHARTHAEALMREHGSHWSTTLQSLECEKILLGPAPGDSNLTVEDVVKDFAQLPQVSGLYWVHRPPWMDVVKMQRFNNRYGIGQDSAFLTGS